MEEHIIATSLKGIKGPATKQIITLFKAMALLPEDQAVPVEVLPLLFQAEADGAESMQKQPSLLRVRKFLKTLIDRSLILGTVDKPSLHDIVREYVIAQHSEDEMRDAHRRLVDSFRVCRPADFHGRKAWINAKLQQDNDPRSVYVCAAISHHIRAGWESDKGLLEVESSCLFDTPQDELVVAAAHMMGVERLTTLASQSEAKEDWWSAAKLRQLCVTAMAAHNTDAVHQPVKQVAAACKLAKPASESDKVDLEDMELVCWGDLVMSFQLEYIFANIDELSRVAGTGAVKRDPAGGANAANALAMPLLLGGNLPGWIEALWAAIVDTLEAAKACPDPIAASKGVTWALGMYSCMSEVSTTVPLFSHTVFARDMLLDWVRDYDYSFHHPLAITMVNGDHMMWNPDGVWSTLVLHCGDFTAGESYFQEHCLRYIQQTMAVPGWDAGGKEDLVRSIWCVH